MPKTPRFRYFLSNDDQPVIKGTPLWDASMPINRHPKNQALSGKTAITYGEYFEAASLFLEAQRESITEAAKTIVNRRVKVDELGAFAIYLEKHGAFYHPSRVVTSVNEQALNFVLNVAISETGKSFLDQEYENLNRLNDLFPYDFLPRVYALGGIAIDEKRNVKMFVGEWFEGYAEFHVSENVDTRRACIKVWDPKLGSYALPEEQNTAIYEKAAEVLTAYYNIETCEQIFSWHHAAGDFIIKFDENGVNLKLVTVRRYDRILESDENGPDLVLHALLFFLLNMSIRMRLDRLNGVGAMTWIDDDSVYGTLNGFFNGLDLKERSGSLPAGFAGAFKNYLLHIPKEEIEDLFDAIAKRLTSEAPEAAIIKANLRSHAAVFMRKLNQI